MSDGGEMNARLDPVYFVWDGSFTDFETAYRSVAEAGVRKVVMDLNRGNFDMSVPADAAAAGRILRSLGLAATACHGVSSGRCHLDEEDAGGRAEMMRNHLALMRNTAAIGCRTYVIHIGFKGEPEGAAAAWERIRRSLDELIPAARSLGLVLALENGMSTYIADNEELLSLVAGYACPEVGICFDSGHAHIMGDAVAALERFSPHVVTVHLHDNDKTGDRHLLPGEGTIDWPSIAAGLRRCPRLVHAETEAANCVQWPPSGPVRPVAEVYRLYRSVLGLDAVA